MGFDDGGTEESGFGIDTEGSRGNEKCGRRKFVRRSRGVRKRSRQRFETSLVDSRTIFQYFGIISGVYHNVLKEWM